MDKEFAKRNNSLKLIAIKLRELCSKTLEDTHGLAMQRPVGKTTFLRVIEATYRRAYSTLDAVCYLSAVSDFGLGNPSMILTRSLIEDVVSVEYMLATDKEEMAKKFQNYSYMQGHDDNKFLGDISEVKQPIIQASVKDIEDNYRKVRNNYQKTDGQKFRNWAGVDIEGMLRALDKLKPALFSDDDIKSMGRSYVAGSRKTHFNPIDLVTYLDEDMLKFSYAESAASALAVGLSCYVRLTTRYIDEISHCSGKNMYRHEAAKAIETLEEMNNMDIYKPKLPDNK